MKDQGERVGRSRDLREHKDLLRRTIQEKPESVGFWFTVRVGEGSGKKQE